MKKIEIINRSDATEQFACILVAEAFGKDEYVYHILERVLKEFPVTEMDFYIPKWLEILPASHWLKSQIIQAAKDMVKKVTHMKDITSDLFDGAAESIRAVKVQNMNMADGSVSMGMDVDDSYYYQILSDYVGIPIEGEYQLMQTLSDLAKMRAEYEKVNQAMSQVRLKGDRLSSLPVSAP